YSPPARDPPRRPFRAGSPPHPRPPGPQHQADPGNEPPNDGLNGRHPDYWHFLTETAAVRDTAERVVRLIREERGGQPGH
ncbi:hypothetical protein ACFW9F_28935, partial [Streptomyces sp. NPDC059506]